jgi:hypothetical protein
MKIQKYFLFYATFFLVSFIPLSALNAIELSRTVAEKEFMKRVGEQIVVKIQAPPDSEYTKLFVKNEYATPGKGSDLAFIPTSKLMPFFIETKSGASMSRGNVHYFGGFNFLHYGTVRDAKVTGISPLDNSNNSVEIELQVEPNEIGKLLGNYRKIFIVTKYKLYDDGWRFKEIDWKETNSLNSWNEKLLSGFWRTESILNKVLWNMHEMKRYSNNYASLLSELEKSENISYLDTAAWVYKDNGMKDKAIDIYEKKIIPSLKQSGNEIELNKFIDYLDKIKSPEKNTSNQPAMNQNSKNTKKWN